ncbi:hypothetical protein KM043_009607 [Ampulex compressa]|nr:hypothetical protein KM043_009607 [Ampulex compressa]
MELGPNRLALLGSPRGYHALHQRTGSRSSGGTRSRKRRPFQTAGEPICDREIQPAACAPWKKWKEEEVTDCEKDPHKKGKDWKSRLVNKKDGLGFPLFLNRVSTPKESNYTASGFCFVSRKLPVG